MAAIQWLRHHQRTKSQTSHPFWKLKRSSQLQNSRGPGWRFWEDYIADQHLPLPSSSSVFPFTLWRLPDQFLTIAFREYACWPTSNLSYDIDIHTWLNYSLMKYTGLSCYYRVKLRPHTEVSSSTEVGKSPEPFIPFLQRIHWPPKIMNSWLGA
jgi:hypothetical protein